MAPIYFGGPRVWLVVSLLLTLVAPGGLARSERGLQVAQGSDAGRRVALVIGNNAYGQVPLKNAVNDATDMAATLRELDFAVEVVTDVTQEVLERAVTAFVARTVAGDVALFYYSGHGIQIEGDNRLLGTDFAAADEVAARHRSLSASEVLERLQARGTRIRIIILDACRDNPFQVPGARSARKGLASMDGSAYGTLIAFATAPGDTASDNPDGDNGLFTAHLLDAMSAPGREVVEVFHQVQQRVAEASALRQVPWFSTGLVGRFIFRGGAETPPAIDAEEDGFWNAAVSAADRRLFTQYLERYGNAGKYSAQARLRLAQERTREGSGQMSAGRPAARPTVAVLGFRNQTGQAETGWMATTLSEGLVTELVASGTVRAIPGEVISRMRHELSLPEADTFAQDTLDRIRRNVEADFVISGSVLALGTAAGRRIRVDVRIEDTRAGQPMTAFSVTGTEAALFDLITDAGGRLRKALGLAPPSSTQVAMVRAAVARQPAAQQHYGDGLIRLRNFDAPGARQSLMEAIRAEPTYAPAYAALSSALMMIGHDAEARSAAERALELGDGLPPTERRLLQARAWAASRQWSRALSDYQAIFADNPDDLEAGLRLAEVQYEAADYASARQTSARLRQMPVPARDDPRIDIIDGEAAAVLGDVQEARVLAAQGGTKALSRGAWLVLARARIDEAWATQRLGRRSEALALNEEARRLYATAGDRHGIARALIQIGAVRRAMGRNVEAEDALTEALQILRDLGNRRHLARAANNLASVQFERGALAEAAALYEEALSLNRQVGDRPAEAAAANNLASVRYEQGAIDEARRLDAEALEIRRTIGDRRGIALSLVNMAEVESDQGRLGDAQRMYEEAIRLNEALQDPAETAYALHGLAAVFSRANKLDAARPALERALRLQVQLEDHDAALRCRVALVQILMDEGRVEEAERDLRAVLADAGARAVNAGVAARSALASVLLWKQDVTGAMSERDALLKVDLDTLERPLKVAANLAVARADAAGGRQDAALDRVRKVLDDVARLPAYVLEARVVEAEIELARGDEMARERLRLAQRDAEKYGLSRLAMQAGRLSAARP
jgi:tetratricopeptide (TPR) repeat protein